MKNKIAFLLFCVFVLNNSFTQNVYIPDAVFKKHLLSNTKINTDRDTSISFTEAAAVKDWYGFRQTYRGGGMDPNISDLTGIEAFVNLQSLNTGNHDISKIDLSKNINLESLYLTYFGNTPLDLSPNIKLNSLKLSSPQTNIDLSKLTLLESLNYYNGNIQSIDLSKNTQLKSLGLNNNQLTSLDLSHNTQLIEISAIKNKIKELNLDNLTLLTSLKCDLNDIQTLDLNYSTNLQTLSCSHNNLKSLDLVNKTNLCTLKCNNNNLSILDLSNSEKLNEITCDSNFIKTILIGNSTNLKYLRCTFNQIKLLDLSKFNLLAELNCKNNQLENLILPENTLLRSLDCSFNRLTTIDFSPCKVLDSYIRCNNNLLTEIILPATALYFFDCSSNNLSGLNFTNLTGLSRLNCANNKLKDLNTSKFTNLYGLNCAYNPDLSTICLANFYNQFTGKYIKDPEAIWSLCQPETPLYTCNDHIKETALCEDFKDADPSTSDNINEYVLETNKTRWENNGPVLGEHAYMGMFWTEANDKNGFTAHKKRTGNGILEYTITQKDTTYEPFMLVFGSYADGDVERKLTLDLSNDKTLSFDLKNTGDSAINASIQLEDINGNSLVFDKSYENSSDKPFMFEIGTSGIGWPNSEYMVPNGKSTFSYDYSDAICGITELVYDDFLNRIRPMNVPHPEIKFDYSKVAMVKFIVSGNQLKNQKLEISNFRLGDAGLIDAIVDQNINESNTIYTAYDLLGNLIDSGKESDLKLQNKQIYILKSNTEFKKKMIIE